MLVNKGDKNKNWVGECRDVTPTKLQSQNIFKEHWGGGGGGFGRPGFDPRPGRCVVSLSKRHLLPKKYW